MYVSPISTRFVRGRSTPEMRAMSLSLTLLVLLIRANHAHDTLPAHDLALDTNPFDRCSYLHRLSLFDPRRGSSHALRTICRRGSSHALRTYRPLASRLITRPRV